MFPPDGLEFRDEPVTSLPLVPRPANTPVRIYQAVSSDQTMQYAARERHVAVFWQLPRDRLAPTWRRYEQLVEEFHSVELRPGEDRMLVVNVSIGDSAEADISGARNAGLPGVWLHRGRPWPLTAFQPGHTADTFPLAVTIVLTAGN